MNDTKIFKFEYWTAFADYVFQNAEFSNIFKRRKTAAHHWYDLSMGSSEFHIGLTINTVKEFLGIEIYIDNNKELFDQMYADKDKIKKQTGLVFEWNRLDNRKACRIIIKTDVDLKNKDKWDEQFEWFIDTTIKMNKAFINYI